MTPSDRTDDADPSVLRDAEDLATRRFRDAEAEAFFRAVGASPEKEEKFLDFHGQELHADKTAGIEVFIDAQGAFLEISLHAEGHDGYARYRGSLPRSLSFDMTRADVRGLLGAPTSESPRDVTPFYSLGPRDVYAGGPVELAVEYALDADVIGRVLVWPADRKVAFTLPEEGQSD